MSPKVKYVLDICLKNAVMAILTNGGLNVALPATFNFHSWTGVKAQLFASGSAILSRELIYWGPRIYKWASSVPNGGQ